MAVRVGDNAPQFSLPDSDKKQRTLAEFKGKNVVLAFFPGAFTGVCTKEMCAFRDSMSSFNGLHATVVGVSVDSPFSNGAFAKQNNIQFPLLSDYKHEAINDYGVAMEGLGGLTGYVSAKRAVFLVDKEGVVKYSWISDNPGVEPPYDDIGKALGLLH